jgi:hypothetical protein
LNVYDKKKLAMKRYGDELYMNMLFVLAYAFIYTSLGLGFPYIYAAHPFIFTSLGLGFPYIYAAHPFIYTSLGLGFPYIYVAHPFIYARAGIVLTHGKHLHDRIISPRREI